MTKSFFVALVLCQAFSCCFCTDWEDLFLELPQASSAQEHLQYYTSLPHPAGTPEDYETANYTLHRFLEYGLNATIVSYDVLLNYPVQRSVTLLQPEVYSCGLQEAVVPNDPTTKDPRIIPTFNGYSPSGNVTGELVYVNYGSVDDFAYLKSIGVDVAGKIGIARYGRLFRGTKAMIAQLNGMIGLLIYSDPADDGYSQGPVFPDGPWRPETGVQRGSVQFLSMCPGDPRRSVCSNDPNYNYTQGIPRIPVQPISWGDALPLLRNLGGQQAPSKWNGGLNFTYSIGPGPAVVNVNLEMKFVVTPIWNVIATIPGAVSDRAVIIGNHRDAWVFGATDPNSGTAAMLEVARAFGQMLQQGWKPRRTIVLASWDGEEYGLLGSTAWAEDPANNIQKNAVAYLNVDVAVTGPYFGAAATPSLAHLLRSVTKKVMDPNTGRPISEVWNGAIDTLGSGSDYTAFLDRFGVASLDMGFNGPYGVYHSIYDDFYWMSHFGDPTFAYHIATAQIWGLMAIRLAENSVVPFNFTDYSVSLQGYFQQMTTLIAHQNLSFDTSQLQATIGLFAQAAAKVNQEITTHTQDTTLNDRLIFTERQFLSKNGLPGRPYFKHVIQAPGLYEGYDSNVFPGVWQALKNGNLTQATEQYKVLCQQLMSAATFLSGQNNLLMSAHDDEDNSSERVNKLRPQQQKVLVF